MTELKVMDGHVFTPSLQDISLKRFRMRYCPLTDGYFLHWDNKVGQHLTRVQGLENGVHNMYGIQRCVATEGEMSYLSIEKPDLPDLSKQSVKDISEGTEKADTIEDDHIFPPSISWKLDFGDSGLAIKNIQIKARVKQFTEEYGLVNPEDIDSDTDCEPVTFQIVGDKKSQVDEQIYLGDYYTKLPTLKGSKSVILTAHLNPSKYTNNSVFLLPSSNQRFETPLDIVVNLMCLKREEWPFVGEILLGMKYSESGASESINEKPDITVECGVMGGQLQVHIVEGAGLVKEGTKKAFNSFVKCQLLPDQENVACKQTSPKHNAYPTWTKEFIFAGIDAFDLSHGGIELLLYDHHKFFSNSLIGGIRLTQPQRIVHDSDHRFSTGGTLPITQPISRDCSPVHTPVHTPEPCSSSKKSFLDIVNSQQLSASQPDLLSIDLDDRRPHTHFATINRQAGSISPITSSSPLLRRVPVFTIPRGSNSPSSSFGSPKFFRKNQHKARLSLVTQNSPSFERANDKMMYPWMDSTRNEVTHWKQVLSSPGQWIYCWHIIRPQITPATD